MYIFQISIVKPLHSTCCFVYLCVGGVSGFNGVYGHGAFLLHNRTLVVVGGFHGTVSNSMLAYTLPTPILPGPAAKCELYTSQVRQPTMQRRCLFISLINRQLQIIIYHDFLPPPRRGSHVKSDNTDTIINIHPLAHILDICALIFSSCALFTVYPDRIL